MSSTCPLTSFLVNVSCHWSHFCDACSHHVSLLPSCTRECIPVGCVPATHAAAAMHAPCHACPLPRMHHPAIHAPQPRMAPTIHTTLPCMPPPCTCHPAMHAPTTHAPPAIHGLCHAPPPHIESTPYPPHAHMPPITHVACHACTPPAMHTHPYEQNDWQTPVKILPCSNFIAGGNKWVQKIWGDILWCFRLNILANSRGALGTRTPSQSSYHSTELGDQSSDLFIADVILCSRMWTSNVKTSSFYYHTGKTATFSCNLIGWINSNKSKMGEIFSQMNSFK